MQDKVIEKPIKSNKKVYIINDSEKMTTEAQNCLLKTLEEPPEYIVIILITSNENLMLNTIKSRCTKINFKELTQKEIAKILSDKFDIKDASSNIITASEGSVSRALKLYKNKELYEDINNIIENINSMNLSLLVNKAESIYKGKEEIENILNYINILLYAKMKEDLQKSEKYVNSIKIVEETKNKLNANTNYDMCIDYLLFKLWEELNR